MPQPLCPGRLHVEVLPPHPLLVLQVVTVMAGLQAGLHCGLQHGQPGILLSVARTRYRAQGGRLGRARPWWDGSLIVSSTVQRTLPAELSVS